MLDKKTVFVLGAGASCPYGYPSGTELRKQICLDFNNKYLNYLTTAVPDHSTRQRQWDSIKHFPDTFFRSSTKSIDLFLARNRHLASIGKYIIAFQIFNAEQLSHFCEQSFQERDWYFYLFNRITGGTTTENVLPDFSNGKVGFITFNYDRSLEHFLYDSFRNSFTNVPETQIIQCLKSLKIMHIYGQIAPLKWQNAYEGVDYRPPISESLLQSTSQNIRTIYEEQQNPELKEAQDLLSQAEQIFFLGFGFAPENMEILGLPEVILSSNCHVYGTAFGLNRIEVKRINIIGFKRKGNIHIEVMDCLELLRNYLN